MAPDPAVNPLRDRLNDDGAPVQYAVFLQLGHPLVAEICAGAGFELVVVDTEHGPSGISEVIAQLQAIGAGGAEAAVRVPEHDPAAIKRVLDAGATTLIVPMVDDAEQARAIVAATRYPPVGIRGAASARAARWGAIEGYHANANDGICVVAMIESPTAIGNLEAICAVDGIDVAFIGPTDLSTALGSPGGATEEHVVDMVDAAIRRIARCGATPGVFAASPQLADRYIAAGARLVGSAVDGTLLAAAAAAQRMSMPTSAS